MAVGLCFSHKKLLGILIMRGKIIILSYFRALQFFQGEKKSFFLLSFYSFHSFHKADLKKKHSTEFHL